MATQISTYYSVYTFINSFTAIIAQTYSPKRKIIAQPSPSYIQQTHSAITAITKLTLRLEVKLEFSQAQAEDVLQSKLPSKKKHLQ